MGERALFKFDVELRVHTLRNARKDARIRIHFREHVNGREKFPDPYDERQKVHLHIHITRVSYVPPS